MNSLESQELSEYIIEWLQSHDTYAEEKRAFFKCYRDNDRKITKECLIIVEESTQRQIAELEKQQTEIQENETLLNNVLVRQTNFAPGSMPQQIIEQGAENMDKIVDNLEKELDQIEAMHKSRIEASQSNPDN